MVASIYNEILQYEEVAGDMISRLKRMNVYNIFEPIANYYVDDIEKFNRALFFILHTYSIKSKFHILGANWIKIKIDAAESVGIIEGDSQFNDVVLMESKEVVKSIQGYLDYQLDRNFKHLCMLKDLYEQMVSSAVDHITKGEEVDYDQKFKNHKYAADLLIEIGEWEQKVADNSKDLKQAMEEMRQEKSNTKKSLLLEDNVQ